jgi:phage FluMu protein Com
MGILKRYIDCEECGKQISIDFENVYVVHEGSLKVVCGTCRTINIISFEVPK